MGAMSRPRRLLFIALGLFACLLLAGGTAYFAVVQLLPPRVGVIRHWPVTRSSDWTDAQCEEAFGSPGKLVKDDRAAGGGYVKEWRGEDCFFHARFDPMGNPQETYSEDGAHDSPSLIDRLMGWIGL
jgi:hypothetical protein